MSYISELCDLLLSEGYRSSEQAYAVRHLVNPKDYDPENDLERAEDCEQEDVCSDEALLENKALLEDEVEQGEMAPRVSRSHGGSRQRALGRRAIKAPDLNELITGRFVQNEKAKCLAFTMLAHGEANVQMPTWEQWANDIESLYEMDDESFQKQLKAVISKAVTEYVFEQATAQLMALYEGSFVQKELLADVYGPSVTAFLTAMQDNYDMVFTCSGRLDWLYSENPNLVVMRKALIVRNKLRNTLTGTLKSVDDLLGSFLDDKCHAILEISWEEFQERELVLEDYLQTFLNDSNSFFQKLHLVFGAIREPRNVFAMKLLRQWVF